WRRSTCSRRGGKLELSCSVPVLLQLFQFNSDVFDRLVAFVRIFCQAPANYSLQLIGSRGIQFFHVGRGRVHYVVQRIQGVFSCEWFLSGHRLKENATERKNI